MHVRHGSSATILRVLFQGPPFRSLRDAFPRIGKPGSRSAGLHRASTEVWRGQGFQSTNYAEQNRFALFRWLGLVGTLLIGLGGLGGGALPVVDNPWFSLPGGAVLGRMMQASSSIVLFGVGLLVTAWLCMGPFVGVSGQRPRVSTPLLLRTFVAWVMPLLITAPLFTQDIYSYLANGAIVRFGLDPYSAGPVELLGAEHHLARSVPFIWAHSPSPYGPVALGIAAAISSMTADSIVLGVIAHRLVSFGGVLAAAWGIRNVARRCGVPETAALWLGILNPLTILHLIGGIHNEAIMLGFVLVGLELGLRGVDLLRIVSSGQAWGYLALSAISITCGGLVKVTGFIGLGFIGMAIAQVLAQWRQKTPALGIAIAFQTIMLVLTTAAVSSITGIGLGWVTGQGGAASIRSWLSVSTDVGVVSGFVGMLLGLGDHIDAMLIVTRGIGVAIAVAFLIRLLWATLRGAIHPAGGLGVATLVLVIFFPVVHPWYPLWAIYPLAAWANRFFFRAGVAVYSATFSFLVLPRGLGLQAKTVFAIYGVAACCFVAFLAVAFLWYRRFGTGKLH